MKPSIPNPHVFPLMGIAPEDQHPVENHGMTLREYFAAHAPGCPDWYWPEFEPAPKQPRGEDYVNPDVNPCAEQDRKTIAEWLRDGCYDLPEHLRAFQRAFQDYQITILPDWERRRDLNRVVAWRWEYADLMLAYEAKADPDAEALDEIQSLLSGQSWSPDDLDLIADVVRKTGRKVEEPR